MQEVIFLSYNPITNVILQSINLAKWKKKRKKKKKQKKKIKQHVWMGVTNQHKE